MGGLVLVFGWSWGGLEVVLGWFVSGLPLGCLWVASELPLSCLWVASGLAPNLHFSNEKSIFLMKHRYFFNGRSCLGLWVVLGRSWGGLGLMKGRRRIDEGINEGSMNDRWRDRWRVDEGSMKGSMKDRWRIDESNRKNKQRKKTKKPKEATLYLKLCNSRSPAPGGCYVKVLWKALYGFI